MGHQPGEILDGKYEILGRLGTGGMGEVYSVRHAHLGDVRVVKILRQDLAADPAAAQRFLLEARTATSIQHPNVATLYDFSKLSDGSYYMVWEHIEGEDLGKRLRERGHFPLPLAVELAIQALRGLDALHQAGIVHRDVSPDNLMITRTRQGQPLVKIIDLGLAKSLDAESRFEITQAGMFLGKLRYCSPEQAGQLAEGEAIDHRSDLYSLAAVLYEMVAGKPPFDSESAHGFVLKRLSEDPLPLAGRNPAVAVPVEVERIVRRGLERDRDRRFRDAVAFIQALTGVAETLRVGAQQEVRVPPPDRSAASPPARPTAPTTGKPAAAAGPKKPGAAGEMDDLLSAIRSAATAPARKPEPSRAGELSKAERDDLLAQIQRAARKVEEGDSGIARASEALQRGRIEEARGLLTEIESVNPRARGLAELQARVAEAEAQQTRIRQVKQTEEMFESYLSARQAQLARLALETLLEIHPEHPRAAELEARVTALSAEADLARRAQELASAARAAIVRGEFAVAHERLRELGGNPQGSDAARELAAELRDAERGVARGEAIDEHRRTMKEHLARGRVDLAERELETLAELEVTRVTLSIYRSELEEARQREARSGNARSLERTYQQRLIAGDWSGAREAAEELGRLQPGSSRPGEMVAEVTRAIEDERRERGIADGIRQLEGFLAEGRVAEAELALRIVLQMAPQHPRRAALEKQLAALRARRK